MRYTFFHVICCAFLLCPAFLLAQEAPEKIYLFGIKVLDAFTEEPLDRAHVSVLETDSSTVLTDSLTVRYVGHEGKREYWGVRGYIPYRSQVVFRIECKGYPTEYHLCDLPKPRRTPDSANKQIYFSKIFYLWFTPEETLPEVQVNASRILMVMKGDTIEYNAAAFRMHEGSMLDNLIRALPGATLDDNGRITVNGEFVNSLLVNGRDFFNGDPKIALRNLPAYTVNKIKVYRRSNRPKDDASHSVSELEKKQDPLVMDIRLKREYEQGWISNYEAGGGSTIQSPYDGKWMGRLFALRYTNHSSLGFYAAANNINDGATPGSKGEWSKLDAFDGDKKNYMGGIQFALYPKDTKISFTTSMTVNHEESLLQTEKMAESFYNRTHTYEQASLLHDYTATDMQLKTHFQIEDSNSGWFSITPTAYYQRNKLINEEQSDIKQAEQGNELNRLYTRNIGGNERETKWGTSISTYRLWMNLPVIGVTTFSTEFSYNKHERTDEQRDRLIYSRETGNNVIEQRRFEVPQFDYTYGFDVSADNKIIFNNFEFRYIPSINYNQSFHSGHQDLNRSEEDWLAPSAAAAAWKLDALNTYHTTRMERTLSVKPSLEFRYKNSGIALDPKLSHYSRRITDHRANLFQQKKMNHDLFDPSFNFFINDSKLIHQFQLIGRLTHRLPDLTYLLDATDSSNPLFRREGNAWLKVIREHRIESKFRFQEKQNRMRFIEVKAGYMGWDNLISQALFYDAASGITTLRPMNIDGNWRAWAKASYRSMMGKGNNWTLSNDLEFNFHHSLDYISDQSAPTPSRSAVDNLIVDDKLRIDYRIREMHIGAKVEVNWKQQESLQHRFERQSFTHINYGITLSTPLFWGIHLGTDIMAYCRRGYSAPSLNTTDWVWNAELSRAVGRKKQWIIKAVGFDLLQEISSIRREVNAQGWTETRYNTKPSYAMLHVVYRLDVKPKKTLQKK